MKNNFYFLQTLSMLLRSGVSLTQAIVEAASVMTNSVLKTTFNDISHRVVEGKSLQQALMSTVHPYLSPDVISLIVLGEQSGNLAGMLDRAVQIINHQLIAKVHFLKTIIQPILLIITGLIIAFIMVAIYLPLFSLASKI